MNTDNKNNRGVIMGGNARINAGNLAVGDHAISGTDRRPRPMDEPPLDTTATNKIFISYRREDAGEAAGRLSDFLVGQFGRGSVFMDVDTIALGRDFRKVLDESLNQCRLLLAIVGRHWLDCVDAHGRRRLDDPADFVRLEVGTALRRDIPVVPVRVQGASMPGQEQLPDDLKDLAYRNAFEITHERWGSDVQLLAERLRPLLASAAAAGGGR